MLFKDTCHIAELAKLKLNKTEEKMFSKQISSILKYVAKLQKLNTSNIIPTSQVTGLKNVWRDDKISNIKKEENNNILKNAPKKTENMFMVKKILKK